MGNPNQVQIKMQDIHSMRRTLDGVDGVDGVEGIGADQNNITRLTIKIFIVDMELSSPFIDINNLNIGVPVK